MQDESNADFSVKYYGGDKGFEGAAGDDRKVCETPRKKPLQHGTLPFESIQTGPQVSASSGHGVLKRDICLKQLRERSSVSEDDVPPPCQSSEAILDEILTEIRTLLPDAKEGHFLCLERTLREMGVLSRRDMKQVKPVDLVNALGTDKANKVAAHFNPVYAECSAHQILAALARSHENMELARLAFSAAAQEIASTLREECKKTRDCLREALHPMNMRSSETDKTSECTLSGMDEDLPASKRAQEDCKMGKQGKTCLEKTLLHGNSDEDALIGILYPIEFNIQIL
ncbi:hypothetical protein V5799_005807 [Amblyomma americanum]|uniref:Uncharacterized protein n=1 Tax=Amblyomma americanum TaxID=6943 RepID=A0AAQ4DY72_AMBAM